MADKRNFIIYMDFHGEIRKVQECHETFKTKNGSEGHRDYMDLQIDDDEGERIYLEDKCAGRWEHYKRGTVGTFKLKISCEKEYGIKAKIEVLDFVEDENA